jgi:hypothetical protein
MEENKDVYRAKKDLASEFDKQYSTAHSKPENMKETMFWTDKYINLLIEFGLAEKLNNMFRLVK